MKRVSWPKRKELVRYTGVVIATVAFVAVYFAITDFGISELIRAILN
ncbi:preprotein translocase subunit SecE [Evansella cellulosilytica]